MRAQDGFGLIEVLVSALVVISAALAVGTAFDAAGHASGRDRSRAVAAGLAQGDQERLRGMDPGDLNNLITTPVSTPKVAGGVTYTVVSSASAQNDPDANPDCGGDSSAAAYIELTSTVTWPNMAIKPVVEQSLASVPPNGAGGRIVVAVQDRNGDPEQGVNVDLTGTRSASAQTSAKGCVSWDNVPPGTDHVTISRSGYVDIDGNPTVTKDVTVTSNRTTSIGPISYDQPGYAHVTFTTTGATIAGWTNRITATQPGMSSARQFGDPTVFPTSIDTPVTLFPFASSYGFWAGDCSAEDPASNGSTAVSARISPGVVTNVVISLPPVNLTVKYGATLVAGADVWYTPQTAGCGSDLIPGGLTNSSGKLAFPAVPYGSYIACAHYYVDAATAQALFGNPALAGDYKSVKAFSRGSGATPTVNVDFNTNRASGTCP